MRDPELLVQLLKELSEESTGQRIVRRYLAMKTEESVRLHHYDLLVDAGHAEWKSESCIRITATGYDFVEALGSEKTGEQAFRKYLERMKDGVGYAKAAADAVKLVAEVVGIGT